MTVIPVTQRIGRLAKDWLANNRYKLIAQSRVPIAEDLPEVAGDVGLLYPLNAQKCIFLTYRAPAHPPKIPFHTVCTH